MLATFCPTAKLQQDQRRKNAVFFFVQLIGLKNKPINQLLISNKVFQAQTTCRKLVTFIM